MGHCQGAVTLQRQSRSFRARFAGRPMETQVPCRFVPNTLSFAELQAISHALREAFPRPASRQLGLCAIA
jgi:hypothetical protein